jgi:hypothetical protein
MMQCETWSCPGIMPVIILVCTRANSRQVGKHEILFAGYFRSTISMSSIHGLGLVAETMIACSKSFDGCDFMSPRPFDEKPDDRWKADV